MFMLPLSKQPLFAARLPSSWTTIGLLGIHLLQDSQPVAQAAWLLPLLHHTFPLQIEAYRANSHFLLVAYRAQTLPRCRHPDLHRNHTQSHLRRRPLLKHPSRRPDPSPSPPTGTAWIHLDEPFTSALLSPFLSKSSMNPADLIGQRPCPFECLFFA
ncbi:hypothetical protein CsSME_00017843 [Camellia sinensis var. sinensis]